ncbi:hypothetical protein AK812_SmicGene29060 [Symbiodinium microadriaticum]|uniref:Uncharacterized protein n=1 Tax=Symbiodinium microadriaticum TaxID=2951 RepID=A0A1Q9D2V8_SYMMI|nr:hypothetical protein AK812_SmicGene29060 [Symbiodinium microadriaticum]
MACRCGEAAPLEQRWLKHAEQKSGVAHPRLHRRAQLHQELAVAHQQLGAQQEITSEPVYAVNQRIWFQQRHDTPKALSASGSMLGTPLAAESDATMEGTGLPPDPFATQWATPREAGQGATLFQPFPVDEETTYSLTAAQMGVDINNPSAVQAAVPHFLKAPPLWLQVGSSWFPAFC